VKPHHDVIPSADGGGLREGAQVGRYTLVSRYATGGMAEIWLAYAGGASGFKKMVVLKILQPELAQDRE